MHFAAATHFLEPFQVTEKSCYDKLMGVMELDLLEYGCFCLSEWELRNMNIHCILYRCGSHCGYLLCSAIL